MTDKVNADEVPGRDDLLTPILAALHELGGSASRGELIIRYLKILLKIWGCPLRFSKSRPVKETG